MLFSAAQHPELAALGELEIAQHTALGRVCIVKPSIELRALTAVPKPDVLFLVDGNNDAIFEQVQSIPLNDYLATLDAESIQPYPWSWPWKDS